MKILAFADVHGDLSTLEHIKKEVKSKKINYVVCAGDYTFFEHHIEFLTKKLSQLGTEVILIHGNHEDSEIVEVLSRKYKNVHFIHKKIKKAGEYAFIGYGGGGFSLNDPEFTKTMHNLTKNIKEKIILVTHAPPNGTKLDFLPGLGYVGNKDYSKFIKMNNVVLAISGHLHERFNKEDRLGKAKVINPGYKGKIITLD
ncbi:TPA: hypothetical protein HA219_04295 [Candidatus Woesearchaeota archaeon]|nr:hypothetical protein [uncultured archaeon]AQS32079.1 hypothetical protein [uncultured archaeon]MBS3115273.1 metallophosphoesterase family protein [Candidatus Woesearchaeota archaeon]HIH39910.1 hypothetical protein [Candidatus Woesearchaeota archaeon]